VSHEVIRNRSIDDCHQLTIADLLLSWFDEHARDLPWRKDISATLRSFYSDRVSAFVDCLPFAERLNPRRDPYAVIVSELMLQQTQVSAVIAYYERFMERFPTIEKLADADETEVLKLWEGLGYYRRARFLSSLAKRVVENCDGIIPPNKKLLLSLPGIGQYTAGAILSFAYDLPEPAVDGNVIRVFSRLDAQPHVRGDAKAFRAVRNRVRALMTDDRAGDFNEAIMDLGATICTPSSPECSICPLHTLCQAYALNAVDMFPVRKDIEEKPIDRFSYVLIHRDNLVYVKRRAQGLLEGMYEFYSFPHPFGSEEEMSFRASLTGDWKTARYANCPFEHGRVREDVREYGDKKTLELEDEDPSDIGDLAEQMRVSFIGDKKAVYSHRIWEVSCWEVELLSDIEESSYISIDLSGEWVTIEELTELPFPAVLVPWRDAFIAQNHYPKNRL
jgi:A/G-specific adenine glycosylase